MAFVLQLIGAIVVSFFILLGVGALYLFLKLRKLKGQITNMASQIGGLAVPVSIELIPEEQPRWFNAKKVDDWTAIAKNQGFMHVGDFRLAMQQGSLARGFVHANGESLAAICEFGNGQIWIDYVQFDDDDDTLTATNVETPSQVVDPPWKTSIRAPKESPENLYKQFCEAALVNPKRLATGDFKFAFEEGFRRVMEWQYISGNVTTDHLDQLSELTGLTIDPQTHEFLRQQGIHNEEADEQQTLINRYLEESGILASDWEKIEDDVVVITDSMSPEDVVSLIEYHRDIEDIEEISERLQGKSGTELFWAIVQTIGQSDQVKVLHHLKDPSGEVVQFL